MAPRRHVPNDFSPLLALAPDEAPRRLHHALEALVAQRPPPSPSAGLADADADVPRGLWAGPTGFAHLFLHVARRHPHLTVAGRTARAWAEDYLAHTNDNGTSPSPPPPPLDLTARVGINCEALAADAVAACLTRDPRRARAVLARIPAIVAGSADPAAPTPDEWLQGRAGTLYLLRLLREWGLPADPSSSTSASASTTTTTTAADDADAEELGPLVEAAITAVAEAILADVYGGWRWKGRRYLGAAHGDAGVLAQLVRTMPELAETGWPAGVMEAAVTRLLDAQRADGNWPIVAAEEDGEGGQRDGGKGGGGGGEGEGGGGEDDYRLVQFCHGAVGVVPSLVALRPHFPALRARIDEAVQRGRACVWREGLLVKEPSICHGIFGSALVLPRGPQRDHFLALTTPERASSLTDDEGQPLHFEPADYGRAYPTISGHLWSAAWTWLVCGDEEPGLPFYTDV